MLDLFTLQAAAFPPSTRIAGFRGSEGLSRPYALEVFLVLAMDLGNEVDMASAVGSRATLALSPEAGPPLRFDGIIASLKLVSQYGQRSVFRATLVPALWQLGNTLHSRVFTEQAVPDIIRAILAENGVTAVQLDLSGSYATEEHVCQYRESDLDFISRWMERLGMYYYFEHGGAEETLVITDDKSTHGPLDPRPVRYYPQGSGEQSWSPTFRELTCEHSALPASVRFKDYDYEKPALPISGTAPAATGGRGEVSLYGNRFFTPAAGQQVALVHAQAIAARQVVYRATGAALFLRSGYTFEIEDHPRAAFNEKYLATSVEHHLNQAAGTPELAEILGFVSDEVYRVTVTAIPASVQYRAEDKTPWPRIYGFENALVDGPAASEYAQIDEMGRYNVKLMFDEGPLTGGKASTKVRMLQPHGGAPEGFHFPLRKDTEVLCSFLGGDPDRPVITGVVPNTLTPSPVTQGNHMTNVIQTGGKNRLEMEDPAGAQRITLSTPTQTTFLAMGAPVAGNHFTLSTEAHGYVQTGMNLGVLVNQKMSTHVVEDNEERYDQNHRVWVTADQQSHIKGDRTVEVKGDQGTAITGDHKFDLKGDELLTIKGNQTHTITGDHTGTFQANRTLAVTGDQKHTITGDSFVKIGSNHSIKIAENLDVTTEGDSSETTDGDKEEEIKGSSKEVTHGNVQEQIFGSRSGVVGGAKSDLQLGLYDDTTVGVHTDIDLGALLEVSIGAKLGITIGLHADLDGIHFKNSELEVDDKLTEIQTSLVSLKDRAAVLEDAGIWFATHGLSVIV